MRENCDSGLDIFAINETKHYWNNWLFSRVIDIRTPLCCSRHCLSSMRFVDMNAFKQSNEYINVRNVNEFDK